MYYAPVSLPDDIDALPLLGFDFDGFFLDP